MSNIEIGSDLSHQAFLMQAIFKTNGNFQEEGCKKEAQIFDRINNLCEQLKTMKWKLEVLKHQSAA